MICVFFLRNLFEANFDIYLLFSGCFVQDAQTHKKTPGLETKVSICQTKSLEPKFFGRMDICRKNKESDKDPKVSAVKRKHGWGDTLPPISWKLKMPPWETKVIFQAPMFHFHDYGRKGKPKKSPKDIGKTYTESTVQKKKICLQPKRSYPPEV